jgi:hypothetical protein
VIISLVDLKTRLARGFIVGSAHRARGGAFLTTLFALDALEYEIKVSDDKERQRALRRPK